MAPYDPPRRDSYYTEDGPAARSSTCSSASAAASACYRFLIQAERRDRPA